MNNLMNKLICSDIRIIELKLKRIIFCKEQLLRKKPFWCFGKEYKMWKEELDIINKEEKDILKKMQDVYMELEKFM